jgi:hypothetical protein
MIGLDSTEAEEAWKQLIEDQDKNQDSYHLNGEHDVWDLLKVETCKDDIDKGGNPANNPPVATYLF